jgi:hypothetical protein
MLTITNNSSTLHIVDGTPYNKEYLENKTNLGLFRKTGTDIMYLIFKDHTVCRPKQILIDWNRVSSPVTGSASDLFTLLSGYLNVPIDNIRAASVAVTAGANTIAFSTALSATTYVLLLWSPDGAGLVETARTVNGFSVDALADGTCVYYAILN